VIIETLVTTTNVDGSVNIAPMGPWVADNEDWSRFELRPFQPSHTLDNLRRDRQGVLHVTDDAYLFAQAIVGDWERMPEVLSARHVRGWVLSNCCRHVEFAVDLINDSEQRAVVSCRARHIESGRNFVGFNRARNAVIEAAILASRKSFLPGEVIAERFGEFARIVERTGGQREREAFKMLSQFVADSASKVTADDLEPRIESTNVRDDVLISPRRPT
jgi:hypothetical protein